MTHAQVVHEAALIAGGRTAKLPTLKHIEELVGFLREIADRGPEQDRPWPKVEFLNPRDAQQFGREAAFLEIARTIRAALEGR